MAGSECNVMLPSLFLLKWARCALRRYTSKTGLGAVTAFIDVITVVLRIIGLGSLLTGMQSALTPLCALGGSTAIPGCTTLLTGNQTCSAPISISLSDTFNVSKCLNQTLILCQNGSQATDQLLLNTINTITVTVLSSIPPRAYLFRTTLSVIL
ncbi:hypothetical protein HPB51_000591 [Rhipicephalus microplus]|uniref:Uncharacterized protein n=1 Tax=Rhipicephalus microplus TaxID=6941 RepID=A0A9J6EPW4_RHIMP|nr:hypothetical protein HPB51_000591 [Rhipicephalus microplus]